MFIISQTKCQADFAMQLWARHLQMLRNVAAGSLGREEEKFRRPNLRA
jgi:hypothetical protein